MRTPNKLLPSLIVGLCLAAGSSVALAQEQTAAPNPPASTPQPSPDAAEPPPYSLDLPELHPSPNSGLFPNGPRQNPPTPSNGGGRNQRSKFNTGGSKARGRSRDRTLQKADNDPLEVRIAYRRDKTQALARDPELFDLSQRAQAARTDTEKRRLLREYYTRLFASIRRMDSSTAMKAHLDLLAQVAEQQYNPQRRAVTGEEDLLNGRDVGRGWLGR